MRFVHAGMTDEPDVRMATSVVDYLFRRIALDHLPYEKRAQLGIFSADERSAQVAATDYGTRAAAAPAAPVAEAVDVEEVRTTVDAAPAARSRGMSSRCARRWTPRRRRRPTAARPPCRSAAPPSRSSCSRARRP